MCDIQCKKQHISKCGAVFPRLPSIWCCSLPASLGWCCFPSSPIVGGGAAFPLLFSVVLFSLSFFGEGAACPPFSSGVVVTFSGLF